MTPAPRSDGQAARRPSARDDPRERIIATAYRLFCHRGVQATGVDRIVAEAGVAKMTLYRHFRSKDELVIAVLERREELWSRDWLEREVERRADTPSERLLAIFDAFDDWFRQSDYESCLFISTLLEYHDATSPVGAASAMHLANVRAFVRRLADEAGARDPDGFAREWQTLMSGSIVLATQGDLESARHARKVAALLLESETLPRAKSR
jgi:AcrR family transcriptional regulator